MRQAIGGLLSKQQSFVEILKSDDKMLEVFALLGCFVEKLVILLSTVH